MKRYQKISIGILVVAGLTATSAAAQLIIYPAQEQSQEQQVKDQGECAQWATQQTGVDPRQVADTATSQSDSTQRHQAIRGAAGEHLPELQSGQLLEMPVKVLQSEPPPVEWVVRFVSGGNMRHSKTAPNSCKRNKKRCLKRMTGPTGPASVAGGILLNKAHSLAKLSAIHYPYGLDQ